MLAVILLGALLLTLVSLSVHVLTGQNALLRGWDAQYYYGLSHSMVYDGDLDITNDIEMASRSTRVSFGEASLVQYAKRNAQGRITSPYAAGLSLLQYPWLQMGVLFRKISTFIGVSATSDPPGYSVIEIVCVMYGSNCFLMLGLTTLCDIVGMYSGSVLAIVLIIFTILGTNFVQFVLVSPFLSHTSSFTLIALCIYALIKLNENPKQPLSYLLLLGSSAGALLLVRPQQVLSCLVFLPFLIHLVVKFPSYWKYYAAMASLAFGAIALHFWFAYAQFDQVVVNPYSSGGGGFDWMHPKFSVLLTQWKSGLFVLHPISILALIGFLVAWRHISGPIWMFLGAAVLQVYVIACWSSPDSGADSFGPRLWSEWSSCLAVGFSYLLVYSRTNLARIIFVSTGICCVGWSLSLFRMRHSLSGVHSFGDLLGLVFG